MRKELWDSMLTAHLNDCYWGRLGERLVQRDKWLGIFIAIMTSSAVAAWGFWQDIPLLWKMMSGLSAVAAIAHPLLDYPNQIKIATALRRAWFGIRTDYELLWVEYETSSSQERLDSYRRVKRKEIELNEGEGTIPLDRGLRETCYREVLKSRGVER
jgi:hypothetical protein